MVDYSDRSLELADELRAAALKNLGRSGGTYQSAITGRFISGRSAAAHPRTTTSESSGRSSKTSKA